jgi:hypothetical protein
LDDLFRQLMKIALWSVRAAAIISGDPPRQILSHLWKGVPSDQEALAAHQRLAAETLAEHAELLEEEALIETRRRTSLTRPRGLRSRRPTSSTCPSRSRTAHSSSNG